MWRNVVRKSCAGTAAFWQDRKGQIVVLAALGFPVMCGFAGLATDAVTWYLWKRELQTGVDAAAIAGGHTLKNGRGAADVEREAINSLERNEVTFTADVNAPAEHGAFAGAANTVEVITLRRESLPFSRMFLDGPVTVSARAVARVINQGQNCVIGLHPSASGAVEAKGSATVSLGCGIIANSQNGCAVIAGGSATVTASPISAVGGVCVGASATLAPATIVNSNVPPQPDPFADLQAPAPGIRRDVGRGSEITLQPGTYRNGIHITGGTATFEPGVYYIDGGTFKVTGQATIIGHGVTFYLTGSGNNYAQVDFAGAGNVTLTAPVDGATVGIPGVLFFQDRNAPEDSNQTNKINGNTQLNLQGALYFPKQNLEFNGSSGGTMGCLKFVASKVTFTGNAAINNVCPAGSGANPLNNLKVVLVE